MTHKQDYKNDNGLLLFVAGFVVVGALGLAVLAGWSTMHEEPATPVASTHSPSPVSRAVETKLAGTRPAHTVEAALAATFETKPPGTVDSEPPEVPTAPSILVDPDANLAEVASAAYASREFDKAIAYWNAEIERRPGRAWSQYMLGLSLWKHGELDEAVLALRRAAELNDASIKTWINLSRVENDRGAFDEALEAADRALELDAENPTALFLRGRSLRNLGRSDEAIQTLESSLAADSENGFVYNLIGLMRIEQQQYDQAALSLERATELEPDVAYIQNNYGMALELSGRNAEAVGAYARATEIDPGNAKAALNLARLREIVPEPTTEPDAALAQAQPVDPPTSSDEGEGTEAIANAALPM